MFVLLYIWFCFVYLTSVKLIQVYMPNIFIYINALLSVDFVFMTRAESISRFNANTYFFVATWFDLLSY